MSEQNHIPNPAVLEIQTSADMIQASHSQRFLTLLLDFVFYYLICYAFGVITAIFLHLAERQHLMQQFNNRVVSFIILALYYIPPEVLTGRTLGKMIMGTKVVNEDGSKLSFGRAIGRLLCRLIPIDAISFLGEDARGWHDRIPKTKVISTRKPGKRPVPGDLNSPRTG